MAANPDPGHITDEIWALWEECQDFIPGVRLGGIYANKSCYHNSVNANKSGWPGGYCIQLPLDLKGDFTRARALDLTMSDAEMRKRTNYLVNATNDPKDDRLYGIREFFGTTDSVNVRGRAKDDENGPWYNTSSDDSHLWHIHISFFTFYISTARVMSGVASVLMGQSYSQWEENVAPLYNYALVKDSGTGKFWLSEAMLWRREVPESDVNDVAYWLGKSRLNTANVTKDTIESVGKISAFGVDTATLASDPMTIIMPNAFSFGGTASAGA